MKAFLLDTNLLIAFFGPATNGTILRSNGSFNIARRDGPHAPLPKQVLSASYPIPLFPADAVRPRDAIDILEANTAAQTHQFWPDERPFAQTCDFAGARLIGH